MKFSLIICTYKRPQALLQLLESVYDQSQIPAEVLIIDASPDNYTQSALKSEAYPRLRYFLVEEEHRGLTRQRNYGISKVAADTEVICFLDDDIILTSGYFENLIDTYIKKPDALGVGGYILEEVKWVKDGQASFDEFEMEGFKRKLGSRNLLRKKLGLLSDKPPGVMPEFSNGLSISFFPPTGKTYPVEFFMGGVASYKREVFDKLKFSSFFEGYGLYEDMDFCLRISRLGKLYVNTAAQLYHHHEEAGRPNRFQYGKMVIRNGWYVWRLKYPSPGLKARVKWHAIALLLTLVRLGNTFTTSEKKEALTESLGRLAGLGSLLLNKPQHEA